MSPRFTPLQRATGRQRILLFTLGPLLWVVALIAVAYVVHDGNAVGTAILVLAGSVAFAALVLVPMRMRRVRAERNA